MTDQVSNIGVRLTLEDNFTAPLKEATASLNTFQQQAKKAGSGASQTKAGGAAGGAYTAAGPNAAQNLSGVNVSLTVNQASLNALRTQIIKGLGVIPVTVSAKMAQGQAKAVMAGMITESVGTRAGAAHEVESTVRRNLPQRAAGGPVQSHQAVIVGEKHPEIFSTRTPGHIYRSIQDYRREISALEYYQNQRKLARQRLLERERQMDLEDARLAENIHGTVGEPGSSWGYRRGGRVRGYGGKYGSVRPGTTRGWGEYQNQTWGDYKGEPGWVYHATDRLPEIRGAYRQEGYGTGVQPISAPLWGRTEGTSWWASDPAMNYGSQLVRTRGGPDFRLMAPAGVWATTKSVSRRALQYWGDDNSWHRFRRGRARMGGGPAYASGGRTVWSSEDPPRTMTFEVNGVNTEFYGTQADIMDQIRVLSSQGAEVRPPRRVFEAIGPTDIHSSARSFVRRPKRQRGGHVEHVSVSSLLPYRSIDRESFPRYGRDFEYLNELTATIRAEGMKQPVEVWYDPTTHRATLGDGNHRLAVAQRLGMDKVPAYVFVPKGGRLRGAHNMPGEPVNLPWGGFYPPSKIGLRHRGGPARAGFGARAYRATIANEGGTFPLSGGPQPTRGYAVGIPGEEFTEFEGGFHTASIAAANDPRDFIRKFNRQRKLQEAAGGYPPFVGTWLHQGQIHIDPVAVMMRRLEADMVARAKHQESIYDLRKTLENPFGREIPTSNRKLRAQADRINALIMKASRRQGGGDVFALSGKPSELVYRKSLVGVPGFQIPPESSREIDVIRALKSRERFLALDPIYHEGRVIAEQRGDAGSAQPAFSRPRPGIPSESLARWNKRGIWGALGSGVFDYRSGTISAHNHPFWKGLRDIWRPSGPDVMEMFSSGAAESWVVTPYSTAIMRPHPMRAGRDISQRALWRVAAQSLAESLGVPESKFLGSYYGPQSMPNESFYRKINAPDVLGSFEHQKAMFDQFAEQFGFDWELWKHSGPTPSPEPILKAPRASKAVPFPGQLSFDLRRRWGGGPAHAKDGSWEVPSGRGLRGLARLPEAARNLEANIAHLARQIDPKDAASWRRWYTIAHAQALGDLADFGFPGDPRSGLAAFATASPGMGWPENRAMLRSMMRLGYTPGGPLRASKEDVPGYSPVGFGVSHGYGFLDEAYERLLEEKFSGHPSGAKRRPFSLNLSGEDVNALTLDSRMAQVVFRSLEHKGLDETKFRNSGAFRGILRPLSEEAIKAQFKIWGPKLGLNNFSEFQAVLWSQIGGADLGADWASTKSGIAIPRHPGLVVPLHRALGGVVHPSGGLMSSIFQTAADWAKDPFMAMMAYQSMTQNQQRQKGGPARARGDWGLTPAYYKGPMNEWGGGFHFGGKYYSGAPGGILHRLNRDYVGPPMGAEALDEGLLHLLTKSAESDPRLWRMMMDPRRGRPESLSALTWMTPANLPSGLALSPFPRKKAAGGDAAKGLYIVGEIGPELFVPKRLSHLIPKKVMDQIPKAADGMQVIGKKRNELFAPPEDGIIVPNRLMDQIPHAAPGRRGRFDDEEWEPSARRRTSRRRAPEYGSASADEALAAMARADEELERQRRIYETTIGPMQGLPPSGPWTHVGRPIPFAAGTGPGTGRRGRAPSGRTALPRQLGGPEAPLIGEPFPATGPTGLGTGVGHPVQTENIEIKVGPNGRIEFVAGAGARPPRGTQGREPVESWGIPGRGQERMDADAYRRYLEETPAGRPGGGGGGPRVGRVDPSEREQMLRFLGVTAPEPGYGHLLPARTSRGAVAALASFLGVGAGQARKEKEYKEARAELDRRYTIDAPALKAYHDEVMTTTASLEEQGASQEEIKAKTDQIKESYFGTGKSLEKTGKAIEDFQKKADAVTPSTGNVIKNLGVIIGATSAYGLAMQAANAVIQPAIEGTVMASQKMADQFLGFRPTFTAVTNEMAKANIQLHGNVEATIAQSEAAAGMKGSTDGWVRSLLEATIVAKSASKTYGSFSDLFRSGMAAGGTPEGLYGGYGGVLGTAFLAQQLGGGKGLAEQMLGDISQFTTAPGENLETPHFAGRAGGTATMPGQNMPSEIIDPTAARRWMENINRNLQVGALSETGQKANIQMAEITDEQANTILRMKDVKQEVKDMAARGFGFTDASGKILVGGDAITDALKKVATGISLGDPAAALRQMKWSIQAQVQALSETTRRSIGLTIPYGLTTQVIQQPLLPPGTGIFPGAAGGAPGVAAAGGGPATGFIKSLIAQQGQAQTQIRTIASRSIADMFNDISDNLGIFKAMEFGVYAADAMRVSLAIADINKKVGELQASASSLEWQNSIRIAKRSLGDALGMAGLGSTKAGGQTIMATNLGRMERASHFLEVSATRLSLALQERQITTQRALAGFQAPGETGEERYMRQKQALAEAAIAERKLTISEKEFGLSQKIWIENANRAAVDARKAVDVMVASQAARLAAAEAEQTIADNMKLLAQDTAKMDAIVSESQGNWSTALSAATTVVGQFGSAITNVNQLMTGVKRGGGTIDGLIINLDRLNQSLGSPSMGPFPTGKGGKKIEQAAGFLGDVNVPTTMIVGEAGPETVAILRNPRMGSLAGGGSSPTNISISINGPVVRGEQDISALAQAVAAEVERTLSRKGQMLGLRAPAY